MGTDQKSLPHPWPSVVKILPGNARLRTIVSQRAQRQEPKEKCFFVISVFHVVIKFFKSFAFRWLRWNDAGYKNNAIILHWAADGFQLEICLSFRHDLWKPAE